VNGRRSSSKRVRVRLRVRVRVRVSRSAVNGRRSSPIIKEIRGTIVIIIAKMK
jgi:hypothetical protein